MTYRKSVWKRVFLGLTLVYGGACATEQETGEATVSGSVEDQMQGLLARYPDAQPISDHELAWNDGSVVLSIPADEDEEEVETEADDQDVGVHKEALAAASVHNCPSGWYCFYQHKNFGGRMLKFRDCPRNGGTQYLTTYGFENQTTSWVVNRKLNFVNVNDEDGNRGFPRGYNLWNAEGNSQSSNVGSTNNDRADWFICYGS